MESTDKIPSAEPMQNPKRGKRTTDKEESRRMGDVIRKYRTMAKLEQKQVAAALGYTTAAIGNWELGLARPSLEALGPLCNMLNIPIDEFLGVRAETILPAEDKKLLQDYHRLTPYNKDTVDFLMQRVLYQQEKDEKARLRKKYQPITFYETSGDADIGCALPGYEFKHDV